MGFNSGFKGLTVWFLRWGRNVFCAVGTEFLHVRLSSSFR